MRLVCPNCDAEYEVDPSVIPDGGRDVQCSNCGNAWFQMSPEAEAELAAEEALFDAPTAQAVIEQTPASAEPDLAEPAPPELTPPEPDTENPPPPPTDAPRRSIDESVLAVLREEAARETEVRKAETPHYDPPVIESQTDLGLQAPAAGLGAVARRLARLKGEPEPKPDSKPQNRRDMFPEIEEINSTLRASNEKRTGGAAAVASTLQEDAGRRSGFRSGFVLMLLLAVILVAAYVMAPKLAQQFPAAASALNAYVAAIDAARSFVDTTLKSAIGYLRELIGRLS